MADLYDVLLFTDRGIAALGLTDPGPRLYRSVSILNHHGLVLGTVDGDGQWRHVVTWPYASMVWWREDPAADPDALYPVDGSPWGELPVWPAGT